MRLLVLIAIALAPAANAATDDELQQIAERRAAYIVSSARGGGYWRHPPYHIGGEIGQRFWLWSSGARFEGLGFSKPGHSDRIRWSCTPHPARRYRLAAEARADGPFLSVWVRIWR